ncbi:TadE/TadG family type IV pilus assembly protein [Desulfurivibrio sp. C05AmB]|uniref:TadE/TadG family type IV pilus assembly protein n=1 Tax=Desulfurivibrio sp. C05AmB TaxID=3374371 RepID=UPI00376EBBE4
MNKPKYPNRRRGAAMVEFAIVLVLLVLIVFGITELGRALYQQNSLTKAVNAGSRYIARQYDLLYPADAANDQCFPKDSVRWNQVKIDARNLIICGQLECDGADPVVPGLDLDPEDKITISDPPRMFDDYSGSPACVIEISVRTPFVPVFGDVVVPLTRIAGFELNARTEERYIGE